MKYLTWKLIWENNYGYGPESDAAKKGYHMEASEFSDADLSDGLILGYFFGDLNISEFEKWSVSELSQEDALSFALDRNPNAYITDNNYISVN